MVKTRYAAALLGSTALLVGCGGTWQAVRVKDVTRVAFEVLSGQNPPKFTPVLRGDGSASAREEIGLDAYVQRKGGQVTLESSQSGTDRSCVLIARDGTLQHRFDLGEDLSLSRLTQKPLLIQGKVVHHVGAAMRIVVRAWTFRLQTPVDNIQTVYQADPDGKVLKVLFPAPTGPQGKR